MQTRLEDCSIMQYGGRSGVELTVVMMIILAGAFAK